MDAQQSTPEVPEDWAEKKDIAKDSRYENHRLFLEEYSSRKLGSLRWTCTQVNFTMGVRGSIKTEDFGSRLASLGKKSEMRLSSARSEKRLNDRTPYLPYSSWLSERTQSGRSMQFPKYWQTPARNDTVFSKDSLGRPAALTSKTRN